MLTWLRYQRDMRSIKKEMKRLRKRSRELYRGAAREGMKDDEQFAIVGAEYEQITRLEDALAETMSCYLIYRAVALRIPIPDQRAENPWERSHRTGMCRLNDEALASLRRAIRSEKKERLQLWEMRAKLLSPALTGLTGAIGAVIGLIAMLK